MFWVCYAPVSPVTANNCEAAQEPVTEGTSVTGGEGTNHTKAFENVTVC